MINGCIEKLIMDINVSMKKTDYVCIVRQTICSNGAPDIDKGRIEYISVSTIPRTAQAPCPSVGRPLRREHPRCSRPTGRGADGAAISRIAGSDLQCGRSRNQEAAHCVQPHRRDENARGTTEQSSGQQCRKRRSPGHKQSENDKMN